MFPNPYRFRDLGYFTKKERKNLFYFLIISFLIALYPYLYGYYICSNHDLDVASFQTLMDSLLGANVAEGFGSSVYKTEDDSIYAIDEPFGFDPNEVSKATLLRLGLSDFAAQNLVKYREAGGRILSAKGLGKIYGVEQEWIDAISPYVRIEANPRRPIRSKSSIPGRSTSKQLDNKTRYPVLIDSLKSTQIDGAYPLQAHNPINILPKFDLNKATIDQFQSIHGIGPVFSKRIVKFRDKLGGFYNQDQLYEVYGIDSNLVDKIKEQSYVTGEIESLDIKNLSFREILSHPYISYDQTKYLSNHIRHREKIDIDAIKKDSLLFPEGLDRLIPYLIIK